MLHGTGPSQSDPAAVPDSLGYAIRALSSSLSVVFHKQRFPIAPRWIPPTPTASLTATVCLKASESAEIAPVRMHSWNDGMLPGIYAG